jgi:hypothetical protein
LLIYYMHNIIQIVFNMLKVHLPLIHQMTDTYGTCKSGDMTLIELMIELKTSCTSTIA